jgi:hypothetical protein
MAFWMLTYMSRKVSRDAELGRVPRLQGMHGRNLERRTVIAQVDVQQGGKLGTDLQIHNNFSRTLVEPRGEGE